MELIHDASVIKLWRLFLCLCLGAIAPQSVSSPASPPTPKASEVLTVMERVADWQLDNPSTHSPTNWTQGAGYAGLMALASISSSPRFDQALLRMGEANAWKLGEGEDSPYHADDHVVGQTYADLYFRHHDPRMIAPMRERFDWILANPRADTLRTDVAVNPDYGKGWWWCDALFMAPATWLRLYVATGKQEYLDFMVEHWWQTSGYLYDNEEHLYFRDDHYFARREANGRKVFWSRGNGWVMAGLARVLQDLPAHHASRERFVRQFREMADKIVTLQQPDGLWRASLLDPAGYPLKETSGSGFYVFALAWGVNAGLLDRAKFAPAVVKGWQALVDCVTAEGKLTHVQPIGADPRAFDPDSTEVYGVGAFLLAGREAYRLSGGAPAKTNASIAVTVRNSLREARGVETIAVPWSAVAARLADLRPGHLVVKDSQGAVLPSQVTGEAESAELLFQHDFAAGERAVKFTIESTASPTPAFPAKVYARFVPERMDDFAWENDRIAFRMYGPALIKGEGTISSGIDVWVKRTHRLVLDDWYRGKDYHKDHGEGVDDYHVGSSRGCGGLGIWDAGRLHTSSNFATWRVLASGPIRAIFELSYDKWDANGRKILETKRISLDAGSLFNRIESTFTSETPEPLTLGIGIVTRAAAGGEWKEQAAGGWLAYWEPESAPNGHTGCAVVAPVRIQGFASTETDRLALVTAEPGKKWVYYNGAGWTGSGDFAVADDWMRAVQAFARRMHSPLTTRID